MMGELCSGCQHDLGAHMKVSWGVWICLAVVDHDEISWAHKQCDCRLFERKAA